MVVDPMLAGGIPSGTIIEFDDSGEHTWTPTGWTGKKHYACRWSERFQRAPQPSAAFSADMTFLRLVECTFSPMGAADSNGNTEYCEINASYESRIPWEDPVETIEGTSEVLEVTEGRTWLSDAAACTSKQAIPYGMIVWKLQLYQPSVNRAALYAVMNKLNNAPWYGVPTGLLLFENFNIDTSWGIDGQRTTIVTYQFLWRDHDHNEVWRPDKPGAAGWDKTNPLLYGYADFNQLGLVLA